MMMFAQTTYEIRRAARVAGSGRQEGSTSATCNARQPSRSAHYSDKGMNIWVDPVDRTQYDLSVTR